MAKSWSLAVTGSFRKHAQAVELAHKRAATNVMRRSAVSLKGGIRKEVERAGLGTGVANAVREAVYPPRGVATDPASAVYSKAVYKRPGGLVDLLTVFREGAVVRPVTGEFLLIGARKLGQLFKAGFRSAGEKRGFLKAAFGASKILARKREVRIIPRLKGMDAVYQRIQAQVPDKYAKEYEAQIARAGGRL